VRAVQRGTRARPAGCGARRAVVALALFGLLLAPSGVAAQGDRVPASDLVASVVFLQKYDCAASDDPDDDDPDVIEDLVSGEPEECVPAGTGSGTFLSEDGLLVSDAFVAGGGDEDPEEGNWSIAWGADDERAAPEPLFLARPILIDNEASLSLLVPAYDMDGEEIEPGDVEAEPLALADDTDDLALEDDVRLLGYPNVGGNTFTVIPARIAGFQADPQFPDLDVAWIKTSPSGGDGLGGGAAVDAAGELIGVPNAAYRSQLVCAASGEEVDPGRDCSVQGADIHYLRPVEFVHALLAEADVEVGRGGDGGGGDVDGEPVEVTLTVIDAETGDPIEDAFAAVVWEGGNGDEDLSDLLEEQDDEADHTARTDEDGEVVLEITVAEDESYWVGVAADGYETWMELFGLAGEAEDGVVDLGEIELEPA
jgi:S1-C subfamily serine protease